MMLFFSFVVLRILLVVVAFLGNACDGFSFSPPVNRQHHGHHQQHLLLQQQQQQHRTIYENHRSHSIEKSETSESAISQQQQQHGRREVLSAMLTTAVWTSSSNHSSNSKLANAAVGTLPEFRSTNAILQSITVDVINAAQFDDTIAFFTGGAFEGMKLLRERQIIITKSVASSMNGDEKNKDENDNNISQGRVREAWLGFGPETLSIPSTFTLPVSSFSQYGGHASIHIRYDPNTIVASSFSSSLDTSPPPPSSSSLSSPPPNNNYYYQRSTGEYNNALPIGDNIAYLQLGVPAYRISQMVKNGGNIVDAYGWVNVISPCGLPIRAIVGIRPDPIMFLAVNCQDVKKSEEFYNEKLGFVRQEYPYARLNQGQGQFEPPQPPKSVYIGPSPNCMGILLLQNKNRKKPIVRNPMVTSLNLVYAPVEEDSGSSSSNSGGGGGGGDSSESNGFLTPVVLDPSLVPISFISQDYLEKDIKTSSIGEGIIL